ncbi:MAG: hypothetical protein D6797_02785 [Bdellovibrio sp.]|nr:MAG: hypothetical protein D6797_02785 [Bdellovibrio sp.]
MFNTFLNYMRYANLEQIKWELYASQMPQAIGCALESMTNFYCQAADAAQMVNIQAKSYQPGERPQNFWRGIDLLTRQLPVFNNWLLKVRAGVKPQRSVDAYQQKRVLEKRLKLDTRDLQVQGRINEDARKLRGSNDPRIKKDIMFQLIYDLSVELSGESQRKMMGGVGPDPFSDLSKDPRRFACWLLQGVKNPCPEPAEARETLEDYIKKRLNLNVPLREVQYENWPQILARATKQVLLEFSDIILVNSDLLIAAAHERSTRFVSPKEALEMIRSFVQDMLEKSSKNAEHANRKKPLKDTLEMIDQVLKIMNRAYAGEGLYLHTVFPWFVRGMGDDIGKTIGEDDEEINPLSVIYLLLRLDLGVQYFSERLTEFVEWDMVDKIQSGEIPQNIKEILQGVGGEIVRRLSEAGMEGDLLTVKRDLDVAMDQTEINFQIFRELMIDKTDQIPEIIEKLYQRAKEGETGQEGFRGIRYQRLAHFCLMVYISGGWPDNKSKEICRQLTLYGPYADSHPDGKIQLGQLEKALNQIRDPLERRRKRICTYYDFRRKNRIFEILENPTTAL